MPQKILVLSSHQPGGRYNDPIHRGFFEASPHPVCFYGPNEKSGPAFDPSRSLAEIVAEVKADLVLVNMKKRVQDWLKPQQLADVKVKTAIVEVDFFNERKDQSWYEACGFDVLFMRHKVEMAHVRHSRKHWLPFSLKQEWICAPDPAKTRKHDVGFAGALQPFPFYPGRNNAIKSLKNRLAQPAKRVEGEAYMYWWQNCRIGLTCSTVHRYDVAKHLIIPGAGAFLLTDGTPGISDLLPGEAYATYKTDGSDLGDVVDRTLSDPALIKRQRAGTDHVAKQHTHHVRWRQLLAHVENTPRK